MTLCSDAFDQRCGVGILRLKEGLDSSPSKLMQADGNFMTCHVSRI